jgi:hypothetical protein
VLANVEKVSVDHAATVVTPLNFSYYPFSHSLEATLSYSLIAGLITWRIFSSVRVGFVTFSVVLSHWVLNFITHRPDLPLFFGDEKFGLGLWNSLWGTFFVEVGIFLLGSVLYLKFFPPLNRKRKIAFCSLILFLSVIYLGNIFGPKVPLDTPGAAIAGPALAMWLIVIWGYYVDRQAGNRQSKMDS